MKKGRSRYDSRIGKLFFILPALIIIIIVVYAYVQLNSPGTLIITAETCPKSYGSTTASSTCIPLAVSATVNGKTQTTPWTQSLSQGNYEVTFSTQQWYYPPSVRDVTVTPGTTAYAVWVYSPIGRVVDVSPSGFNMTSVTALHGVTPVNWTNPTGSVVTFTGNPFGDVSLEPGQTLAYTFPSPGVYNFTILSTEHTMEVDVS